MFITSAYDQQVKHYDFHILCISPVSNQVISLYLISDALKETRYFILKEGLNLL